MVRPMLRGKVVLVPFPFDDLSSSKLRPAICLTNTLFRRELGQASPALQTQIATKLRDLFDLP